MSVFKCIDDYSQACFDEQAEIGKLLMEIGAKHGAEMLGRLVGMMMRDEPDMFNEKRFRKQPIARSIKELKRHLLID